MKAFEAFSPRKIRLERFLFLVNLVCLRPVYFSGVIRVKAFVNFFFFLCRLLPRLLRFCCFCVVKKDLKWGKGEKKEKGVVAMTHLTRHSLTVQMTSACKHCPQKPRIQLRVRDQAKQVHEIAHQINRACTCVGGVQKRKGRKKGRCHLVPPA